ncbi:MAG TPA: hypothetical protein VKF60_15370 [Myxococcota bacterium]|nr:hypothetical protein [Myxococcota bacterium]
MRDSLVRLALVVATLAFVPGCGSKTYLAKDFGHAEKSAEEASPTGGPSLDQRRENMTRMYKDLVHFRTSLRDSQERGDRTTSNALGLFIESYMDMHLDPLLDGEWQSRHPELWALDADLRLAKADVLMRMNETSRAAKTLDEIASRYKGRDDMLVHYPMGSESPLGKAIKLLRDGV